MGRTRIKAIKQPDEHSCAPTSLKHALTILGKRMSLKKLIALCNTSRNGTTDKHFIGAIKKLGLCALTVEGANLKHILSALKGSRTAPCVALVNYLCQNSGNDAPDRESGHWAVVSSYCARDGKIQLLDSNTGKRIRYCWTGFRSRWMDYEYKKRKISKRSHRYKLIKRWQKQLLVVVARATDHLPRFTIASARLYA